MKKILQRLGTQPKHPGKNPGKNFGGTKLSKTAAGASRGQGLLFFSLALAFAGLQACAPDRDVDDYNRSKLNEDLAKLNAVSGVYVGQLISNSSNQSLGTVGVQLQTATQQVDIDTGKAVLQGQFFFKGSEIAKLPILNSYYDSTQGTLTASVLQQAPASSNGASSGSSSGGASSGGGTTSSALQLAGKFVGANFVGTLQQFGFAGTGSHFTLSRQDQVQSIDSVSQVVQIESVQTPETFVSSFKGTMAYPGIQTDAVTLEIDDESSTVTQRFFDLFAPQKTVTATLVYIDSQFPNIPPQAISFDLCQWDPVERTLIANQSSTTAGINGYSVSLTCQPYGDGGLKCNYKGAHGTGPGGSIATLLVNPDAAGTQQ